MINNFVTFCLTGHNSVREKFTFFFFFPEIRRGGKEKEGKGRGVREGREGNEKRIKIFFMICRFREYSRHIILNLLNLIFMQVKSITVNGHVYDFHFPPLPPLLPFPSLVFPLPFFLSGGFSKETLKKKEPFDPFIPKKWFII